MQMNSKTLLKFYANSNIVVIGSSGSGKTTAVLKIIEQKLIEPMPEKIFYLYGSARQPFMDDWIRDKKKPAIEFIEGLNLDIVNSYLGPKLLICDDLILELNRNLAQHFIAGSTHKQTTTIFITHSLFLNNEHWRLCSNNAHYILLFKDKRHFAQVARFGRQILGAGYTRLVEAYKYTKTFGFVLLSFHPLVPDELLVTTDYFEKCPLKVFM